MTVAYTAMHGVGGAVLVARLRGGRLCRHRTSSPSSSSPTARSRRCRSPTPRSRARWTCCWRSQPSRARWRRSPTIPTPIGSAPRSRSPTGRGGGSVATSSAGCWPSTSCDHTSGDDRLVVTTLVSSSLLRTMAAEYGVHYAETFTGFKWIGRTVLDQPERAVRVRLRAGARLPRRAPAARQGRHHGGDHVRRGGGAGRSRRRDAPGSPRRDRRAVRPSRDGRALDADGTGGGGGAGRDVAGVATGRDRRPAGGRGRRRSPRPTCCGWCSTAASGCRSARAAPNPRSSSTAKPSARIRPRTSPPSPPSLHHVDPCLCHRIPANRADVGDTNRRVGWVSASHPLLTRFWCTRDDERVAGGGRPVGAGVARAGAHARGVLGHRRHERSRGPRPSRRIDT